MCLASVYTRLHPCFTPVLLYERLCTHPHTMYIHHTYTQHASKHASKHPICTLLYTPYMHPIHTPLHGVGATALRGEPLRRALVGPCGERVASNACKYVLLFSPTRKLPIQWRVVCRTLYTIQCSLRNNIWYTEEMTFVVRPNET